MVSFRVVLVEPQNDGNVGAVARSMGNFGFKELCMVSPCEITDEAFKRAKHAGDILRSAKVVSSFEEAVRDCYLVVGTSGIITYGDAHFVRIPITPKEFAQKTVGLEENIALVFGREDIGLTQEQLHRCDLLVNIPAHEEYPVLNLSHAVTIILYEIFALQGKPSNTRPSTDEQKELMFKFFAEVLEAINYPKFRREKTDVMFRRMMGRAVPSRWEFYTIMGVLGGAAKKIRRLEAENERLRQTTGKK
ncbi:MAG: RNA methyltransferase [Methanomassiliicoccales archaeon]|nr:MAG: RNA methyltransferase [Methanomassiliicoccales archaeon]